jgi:hypothetical protein
VTADGGRQRGFCSFCGALVPGSARVVDGHLRCRAHSDLPSEQPPDERRKLPSRADEIERELRGGRQ